MASTEGNGKTAEGKGDMPSPGDAVLALETFLPYRLADAVSREFQTIYKDRYGLTRPEWRTLATLGQNGVMTATAIGEHSAMHKTKVSRAVAELERRKWLTRITDNSDRRVGLLSLTRAGEKTYRELVPLAKAFEDKVMAKLGDKERAALAKGLAALEAAIER